MKVKFYLNTGNKTIVLNPEIRLFHGENTLGEETIKKYGIDKMPGFSTENEVFNRTQTTAQEVVIEDKPAKVDGKLDFDNLWVPSRIINMTIDRFTNIVGKQNNVQKLVELWQFARSKRDMREVLKKRILELDPNCNYL